ncbi:MAG: PhnD/SsuA/transferrin family substrate-binding protein [Paracoccaceae bacterium]
MPFRLGLFRHVQVVGALDYGLEGCAPGQYCSALIVRNDDPRSSLAAFGGAIAAANARNSQSGYAALLRAVGLAGVELAAMKLTGAHAASITAVASGGADIVAIDAVSWRMARNTMNESQQLRVLAMTEPTPGLPLICASGQDGKALRACLAEAFAALPSGVREALKIQGFVGRSSDDYRHSPW